MRSESEDLPGIREGDLLAGKYRVEKVLGIGGMGVVVAAHHIGLDTKVAIKFLLPAMLNQRDAVARFAREARAAVRITSEHVARVFDVGTLDTGAPYMVMEFLEGGDLTTWLRERGPLPVEQAVEFMIQVCVAVADAHSLGIVHRDLKPSNFFCVRRTDGRLIIKVLDFGISKITGSSAAGAGLSFTKTSAVMGSPFYMSPEQMQSPKDVDTQTDIWALGASLYELLTGSVPFEAESLAGLAVKLATEPPPRLRTVRPEAPAGLEAVVLKCLERDRSRRYRNVAELAVALLDFGPKSARAHVERITAIVESGHPAAASDGPPAPQPTAQRSPGSISAVGGPPGSAPRGRGLISVIGLLLGLTIAVTFGWITLHSKGQVSATTPLSPAASAGLRGELVAAATSTIGAAQEPSPHQDPAGAASAPPETALPAPPPPRETKIRVLNHAARTAAPVPSSPASAGPEQTSCSPPFYFDARGARVFKTECVR